MSPDDPTQPGSDGSYVREAQHGPEMDDTQVQATGDFADQLDPVVPDADEESGDTSGEDPGAP